MDNADIVVIKNLYIDLCQASVNKDLKTIDSILADNYILVHMTGLRQTKQDYLNSVKTGELLYFDAIHESIDVTIDDNKATVVGKTKVLASPFGSTKSWWRLRQDLIAEKIAGEWKITYSKASTY